MNGRKAKAIRKEMARRYPRGFPEPYGGGKEPLIVPMRQIKNQVRREMCK